MQSLEHILLIIEQGRESEGKKSFNNYYVCNVDEPYAQIVYGVIIGGEATKDLAEENRMSMIKYPMKEKTEKPLFNYLVRDNMSLNYYLYEDFDEALKRAMALSTTNGRHVLIYENYFNTSTREWHGQNTFDVIEGKVFYDKHAKVDLHIEFYVNAENGLIQMKSGLIN